MEKIPDVSRKLDIWTIFSKIELLTKQNFVNFRENEKSHFWSNPSQNFFLSGFSDALNKTGLVIPGSLMSVNNF